jgi:hypothetical protein
VSRPSLARIMRDRGAPIHDPSFADLDRWTHVWGIAPSIRLTLEGWEVTIGSRTTVDERLAPCVLRACYTYEYLH